MTLTTILGIRGLIDRWAVASQQAARRNAMIASTALTQRRAELDEVEEFLASLGEVPGHAAAKVPAGGPAAVPAVGAVAHG